MASHDLILTKNAHLTRPYQQFHADTKILVGMNVRYVEKPLSKTMQKLYPNGVRFTLLPFEHPCYELNFHLKEYGQETLDKLYQFIIDNQYVRLGQLQSSLEVSKSAAKKMITELLRLRVIAPMSTFYKVQTGWADRFHQYLDPERQIEE